MPAQKQNEDTKRKAAPAFEIGNEGYTDMRKKTAYDAIKQLEDQGKIEKGVMGPVYHGAWEDVNSILAKGHEPVILEVKNADGSVSRKHVSYGGDPLYMRPEAMAQAIIARDAQIAREQCDASITVDEVDDTGVKHRSAGVSVGD